MIRVLSLFDGISGARVALQHLGYDNVEYFSSEIDPYALKVSQYNYSDQYRMGDVLHISSPKHIDLLVGGSPCQDLSIAKRGRKSLDGFKSVLFYEYVRLLNESKPKYFLLENVASMNDESKEVISKKLGVKPILINSSLFTAQSRKRLYWTNIPVNMSIQDKKVYLKDILDEHVPDKYYLSDREIEYMNRAVKGGRTHWDFGYHSDTNNDKSSTLTANLHKGVPYNVCIDTTDHVGKLKGVSNSQANRIYSFNGKSVSLNALSGGSGAKTGLYTDGVTIRKLTPKECEKLQGYPVNYTNSISDTQRYKCLGNSFTVPVIAYILGGMTW